MKRPSFLRSLLIAGMVLGLAIAIGMLGLFAVFAYFLAQNPIVD